MPEISRFFGIIIAMFYNDHAPPHFHARYGEQRVLGLVMKWASLHQEELREDWRLAERQAPLRSIAPLE
ncbi:MAG: DUF4160 domain-containing protein [Candidatus Rokubacteria bacterium]|nr:DUF4160 domain-containing protein [Candidatus Rokubacteria bacterium]